MSGIVANDTEAVALECSVTHLGPAFVSNAIAGLTLPRPDVPVENMPSASRAVPSDVPSRSAAQHKILANRFEIRCSMTSARSLLVSRSSRIQVESNAVVFGRSIWRRPTEAE